MTSKVTFRPATAADVLAFLHKLPPARMKGYAAVLDGEVIAIGGIYYHDGYPVAFSDITDAFRKQRKALAKGVRMLQEFIEEQNVPVYALADQHEPTAPYLLAKLGFKPTGSLSPIGEYLVKEPTSWPH